MSWTVRCTLRLRLDLPIQNYTMPRLSAASVLDQRWFYLNPPPAARQGFGGETRTSTSVLIDGQFCVVALAVPEPKANGTNLRCGLRFLPG